MSVQGVAGGQTAIMPAACRKRCPRFRDDRGLERELGHIQGLAATLLDSEDTMPRAILDEQHIHPAIRQRVATHHQAIVDEVRQAVDRHAVVVVGMRRNPFPRKARKLLDAAGIAYQYLEYGSYVSQWRERTALKMWTGWPTLPMVFVKATLIGGADDLARLQASGELQQLLA
jgi:monothiol glutaredoxin